MFCALFNFFFFYVIQSFWVSYRRIERREDKTEPAAKNKGNVAVFFQLGAECLSKKLAAENHTWTPKDRPSKTCQQIDHMQRVLGVGSVTNWPMCYQFCIIDHWELRITRIDSSILIYVDYNW